MAVLRTGWELVGTGGYFWSQGLGCVGQESLVGGG